MNNGIMDDFFVSLKGIRYKLTQNFDTKSKYIIILHMKIYLYAQKLTVLLHDYTSVNNLINISNRSYI